MTQAHTQAAYHDPVDRIARATSPAISHVVGHILGPLPRVSVFRDRRERLVSKSEMSRLLPDAGARNIAIATGLGAASSSCSYAAVAMTRSMIRKGANFTAAFAFQFAATNLVLELGVLLIVLLGWQFGVAEFVGGPIMIVLLVLLYRVALKPDAAKAALAQASRNVPGAMEGHAQMSIGEQKGRWRDRLLSSEGWIAIRHGFVMNWMMLWKDILVGVLIAGALSAWVPQGVWQSLSLTAHPATAAGWPYFWASPWSWSQLRYWSRVCLPRSDSCLRVSVTGLGSGPFT
jgi:hypothetical protein